MKKHPLPRIGAVFYFSPGEDFEKLFGALCFM